MSKELWYKAGQRSLDYFEGSEIAVFGAGRTVQQAVKAFFYRGMNQKMPIVCGSAGTEEYAKSRGPTVEIVGASALKGKKYVYVDGADQIDPSLNLLKGGFKGTGNPGIEGCMHQEKGLAYGAAKFVVVADPSKLVDYLGQDSYRLPVEYRQDLEPEAKGFLEAMVGEALVRHGPGGEVFVTENGNRIFDVDFDARKHDLQLLEEMMRKGPLFANGLFAVRRPDAVIVAREEGIEVVGPKT